MFYLVRYGEIAIKGESVRRRFEKTLVNNIKASLEGIDFKIVNDRGRIVIETDEDIDDRLKRVFGIVSFSRAKGIDLDSIDDIKPHLNLDFSGSFAVRVRRTGFPGKSNEIAGELGHYIQEETGAKVDLTNPDRVFRIEIRNRSAYIYDTVEKGPGGLPIGTAGRVYSPLETEDDIRAALLMMKRGCSIATNGDASKIEKWHRGQRITEDGWEARTSTTSLDEIKKEEDLVFYPLIDGRTT